MTRTKAEQLAERIRDYWAAQGYEVHTEVIREPWVRGVNTPGWSVRTNLRNGLPPGYSNPKNRRRARGL